jgi:Ca2+-binding RTX toxin-like protein
MALIRGTNSNNILQTTATTDTVLALGGNDWINIFGGSDFIDGGLGNDTVSFANLNVGVQANLSLSVSQATGAGRITFRNVENLRGTAFDDTLTGNAGANNIFAAQGNDILNGRQGNDYLIGGAGNDSYFGGDGIDTASFQFSAVGVTVDLNNTGAQDTGEGLDTLSRVENLFGSSRADRLIGNGLTNVINGGAGNDYLAGTTTNGSTGRDTLIGGAGADTFAVLAISADRGAFVMDFLRGVDKIDLSALTDVAFSDLRITRRDGQTFVDLDRPGTVNDDNLIILRGSFTLTAADFIL